MSSNIYYPERRLLKYSEKKSLFDRLMDLLGLTHPINWQSQVITIGRLNKVFGLKISGRQVQADYSIFSWRSEEIYYDHADLGRVFIPQNIHLTNGQTDMFIVVIDDDFEVRLWPGYRWPENRPGRHRTVGVNGKSSLKQIEESFAALVDATVIDKAFEEKHGHIKGRNIDRSDLEKLLQMIYRQAEPAILDRAWLAAVDPLKYFEEYGREDDLEGPYAAYYHTLIFYDMADKDIGARLDWKEGCEEVRASLEAISAGRIKEPWTEDMEDGDQLADECLSRAGEMLEAQGLAILCWDMGSDEYDVFIADKDQVAEITGLADKCGIKLQPMNASTLGTV